MTTLESKISNAKSLNELCELLNGFVADENDGQVKLENYVDMSALPSFGVAPSDTTEIFSWDENHYLIQNECAGDAFVIVERD